MQRAAAAASQRPASLGYNPTTILLGDLEHIQKTFIFWDLRRDLRIVKHG